MDSHVRLNIELFSTNKLCLTNNIIQTKIQIDGTSRIVFSVCGVTFNSVIFM